MKTGETIITLRNISKRYHLGTVMGKTLQEDLQSWWAKKKGLEDPNSRIGRPEVRGRKTFMALNGIDLDIKKGETLGIIGANGAGKSTLLKLISSITAPTTGDIDIYGRITSMLEVGVGFSGEMTGRENIYLNGAILGMTKKEIDRVIDKIIEFSEAGEFIDTPVKRYSSGMYVKLAFAVASHLRSEILIMDEVLAVGDTAFQNKCIEKMQEVVRNEGRTILYVSHNMRTVRKLCSRCIVLDKGRIIFDGDTDSAIAVYLDHSVSEDIVDMDLQRKSHAKPGFPSPVTMTHLTLADKDEPVYRSGESLVLKLMVKVSGPVEKAVLRLSLRSETDQGIGTGWSEPIDLIPSGEASESQPSEQEITYSMPLRNLKKGTFYVSIGLNQMNDSGNYMLLDHITRAFKIKIEDTGFWDTDTLGHIELDTIRITDHDNA